MLKLAEIVGLLVILYLGIGVFLTWIKGELCTICPKCGKLTTYIKHRYEPPPPYSWIEKYRYIYCKHCDKERLIGVWTKTNIGIVFRTPEVKDGLFVKENDCHNNNAVQASQHARTVAMAAAILASLALTAMYIVAEQEAPVVNRVGILVSIAMLVIAVLAAWKAGVAALSVVNTYALGMRLPAEKVAKVEKKARAAIMTPLMVPMKAHVAAIVIIGLAALAKFGVMIPNWGQAGIAALGGAVAALLMEWWMPAEKTLAKPASMRVWPLAKAAGQAALVAAVIAAIIAEYNAGMARAGHPNPVWPEAGGITFLTGMAALAAAKASAAAQEATTWKAEM